MVVGAIKVFGLLFSGPIFAFVVLAVGCAVPWQLLGVWCGHNAVLSLVVLSVAGWLVAAVAIAVIAGRKRTK
jgi:hypothetical protein